MFSVVMKSYNNQIIKTEREVRSCLHDLASLWCGARIAPITKQTARHSGEDIGKAQDEQKS